MALVDASGDIGPIVALGRAIVARGSMHDTFDALSPAYDEPVGAGFMKEMAEKYLKQPYEIEERRTVTFLRTALPEQYKNSAVQREAKAA